MAVRGLADVRRWLAAGDLLHPREQEPSAIDLSDAIASLCGAGRSDLGPSAARIRDELEGAEHLVVILADGLGANHLPELRADGPLARARRLDLRAVYPSTTAATLTSLATGQWPGEHGITGFWTYFQELSRTLSPLWFLERGTRIPGARLGLTISQLTGAGSRFGSFLREVYSILPRGMEASPYSRWFRGDTPAGTYRKPDQLRGLLSRRVRKARAASLIYAYLPQIDSLSHRHGWRSTEVRRAVGDLDLLAGDLRKRLPPDVRIVITADHGHITIPDGQTEVITDEDPLLEYLVVPPSGESVGPVFHVVPGREQDFVTAFGRRSFADSFALLTNPELEALGIAGPGSMSPKARAHFGTFIAIAREPHALEYVPGTEEPKLFRGMHGGLRPDEIQIPLFIL